MYFWNFTIQMFHWVKAEGMLFYNTKKCMICTHIDIFSCSNQMYMRIILCKPIHQLYFYGTIIGGLIPKNTIVLFKREKDDIYSTIVQYTLSKMSCRVAVVLPPRSSRKKRGCGELSIVELFCVHPKQGGHGMWYKVLVHILKCYVTLTTRLKNTLLSHSMTTQGFGQQLYYRQFTRTSLLV